MDNERAEKDNLYNKARTAASDHSIDENGLIRSPGKFEGEPYYAVWYHDQVLNGCHDDDITVDGVLYNIFTVEETEKAAFNLDAKAAYIYLSESEQGFIHVEQITRSDHKDNETRALEQAEAPE